MKDIKRIIVAIDFSIYSVKILEYTVHMAKKFSAVPYFIHVVNFYTRSAMFDSVCSGVYREASF